MVQLYLVDCHCQYCCQEFQLICSKFLPNIYTNSTRANGQDLFVGARRQVQGVHVHPPGFRLKNFLQRCAIAVIKINAGNAGIKSHNTEI